MAKGLIDDAKKYIGNYYYNGEWLDEPIRIRFNGKDVSDGSMDFLGKLFRFLIDSTMLNECTKIWLLSNMSGIKESIEFYNSQVVDIEKINIHTALSKIQYDKKRHIEKYFDQSMIKNILAYPDKHIEKYNDLLESLYRKFMVDSEYREALAIRLSKKPLNRELDIDKWNRLLERLEVYSKKYISKIEALESDDVSSDMIGYYNYLISSKSLNDIEKERLNELRRAIGLNDIQ